MSLILYYNPMSRAAIAHWMLEETGADYELSMISFDKREHKSPDFLKINPMGKLPTLVHGDMVVTEAAAICAYLADAFPQNKLAPPIDSPLRGAYYRWLFFAAGCFEPAVIDKAFKRPPVEKEGSLGYGTYESTLDTLAGVVRQTNPWLLGDQFTAADVYVGSQIDWGLTFKTIESRPEFEEYVERLRSRQAYKRHRAKAEQLIGEMKS